MTVRQCLFTDKMPMREEKTYYRDKLQPEEPLGLYEDLTTFYLNYNLSSPFLDIQETWFPI